MTEERDFFAVWNHRPDPYDGTIDEHLGHLIAYAGTKKIVRPWSK